jgi:hypothetical protein
VPANNNKGQDNGVHEQRSPRQKRASPTGSDGEEEEEDHTTSYIARGKEVNEVTKTIKRAFRKPEFCKIDISIDKRQNWRVGTDVPIHVKITNSSSKELKGLRIFLETTTIKKKAQVTKSKAVDGLQSAFPIKANTTLETDLNFNIPNVPASSEDVKHQLVLLWTIKGGVLGNNIIKSFLPLTVVPKS